MPTTHQEEAIHRQANLGRTVCYLAIGGTLAGILAVEDRLRPGVPDLVARLREDGFTRILMLTGDEPVTAAAVARQAGIDEFRARLLPEDKASIITSLQTEGCRILMMGDGINDAPALSAASIGVALQHGADMTREIADIVLVRGDPADVLMARRIARLALERIRHNFLTSVCWNACFLSAALAGLLPPVLSALCHNACTAALAVRSMQPLLPQDAALMGGDKHMEDMP
jgi:Cu2+-exporting ATPase